MGSLRVFVNRYALSFVLTDDCRVYYWTETQWLLPTIITGVSKEAKLGRALKGQRVTVLIVTNAFMCALPALTSETALNLNV